MKRSLCYIAGILLLGTACGREGPRICPDDNMRIGTYNLWAVSARESEYNNGKTDRNRLWPNARNAVVQCIADLSLDIIGLQEVSPEMESWLRSELAYKCPGYNLLLRYPDETSRDKQSADGILYKADRFQLLQTERWWISPTPTVQSYGWDETDYRYRNIIYSLFHDKKAGKKFAVLVIHGPQHPESRSHAADIMIEMERHFNTGRYPAFFIGDMNAEADKKDAFNDKMRAYCDDALQLASINNGQKYSFAGSSATAEPYTRLDYIYLHSDTEDSFNVSEYTADTRKYAVNGKLYYPSDHLPVYIKVALEQHCQ